jgi:hypothetical protein
VSDEIRQAVRPLRSGVAAWFYRGRHHRHSFVVRLANAIAARHAAFYLR